MSFIMTFSDALLIKSINGESIKPKLKEEEEEEEEEEDIYRDSIDFRK